MPRSDVNNCLEWNALRNRSGYGVVNISGRMRFAHRLAWERVHGHPGELCVLHRCDNPRCYNVEHLFLGTRQDNNRDRDQKGRNVPARLFGERNPAARIADTEWAWARRARSDGVSLLVIAARLHVTKQAVSQRFRRER